MPRKKSTQEIIAFDQLPGRTVHVGIRVRKNYFLFFSMGYMNFGEQ